MRVAIVGAGFSGIGMGATLERSRHQYAIFERSDDVGGVWHHNQYPGAACDVPSYVYSYSWAQRRDWSRPCSPRQEIQDYLRQVATDRGVIGKVRFNSEVTEARWDPAALRWTLTVQRGDGPDETHEADVLVVGCGQLSRPSVPPIRGADTFAGHAFHSAQWDHGHDLDGQRVAVIGTGASAIQFIPEIAVRAARLFVFQRTAPYLLPRRNLPYPQPVRELLRSVPGVQRLRRYGMYGVMESLTYGFTRSPAQNAVGRTWSSAFMRLQLRGDPELRRRVWPDYPFGCKRVLFSSTYLPTLRRDDVELVSDKIDRITAEGVVTVDGTVREVDTIIWATGFLTNRFVAPMRVYGERGVELQDAWRDGAEAHRGIAVAGYPNLFLLYGPNTNLGAGSIITMVEAQIGYVAQALALISDGRALAVRDEAQQRYVDELKRRLGRTVWAACDSWYRRDEDGRIVNNWPGFVAEYLRDVRRLDPADYRPVARSVAGAAAGTR